MISGERCTRKYDVVKRDNYPQQENWNVKQTYWTPHSNEVLGYIWEQQMLSTASGNFIMTVLSVNDTI